MPKTLDSTASTEKNHRKKELDAQDSNDSNFISSLQPSHAERIMAAAFASINAYIRSKPVLNYVCSTRMLYAMGLTGLYPQDQEFSTNITPLQIFGAQSRISASRSPPSLTRRKIQNCTLWILLSLRDRRSFSPQGRPSIEMNTILLSGFNKSES